MKKILFIFALTFSWFLNVSAQKEKLYNLFDKYQDTEGVTSIKIAKPMFGMLSKLDIKDAELDNIKPMLEKIQGLRILVIEKPEMDSLKNVSKMNFNFNGLQTEISNSLKNLHYEELMTVNSKDNKIKFLAADAANGILDNLLLSVNSDDNMVLMMLDGKISMDDVNKLANEAQNAAKESSKSSSSSSSNAISEEARKVGKFSGIQVSSGIKVSFTQDSNQKVTVETNSNLQKYVKTEVVGDILKIYVENPKDENLNFNKILVDIKAPELSKIAVNQGANFTTENTVNADYFQVATTSGGNLSADLNTKGKMEFSTTSGSSARVKVNASELEMSATSGSDAVLTGNISETKFTVSSAANVNAQDLVSKRTTISASSASSVKVNVSEKINANISSGANVRYRPNSSVDRNADISSGGSMKPL